MFFKTLALTMIAVASLAGSTTAADADSIAPAPASAPTASELKQARAALAARRADNAARLRVYSDKGAFPRNRVGAGLVNVFQDASGALCAVANLIHLDGHTTLIADTARTNNLIVLGNVKAGPLMDWMLTSGFTQGEIALIQEPYMEEFPDDQGFFAREDQRLRSHFASVQLALKAKNDASLDAALAQLAKQPTLLRAFIARAG